MAADFSHSPGFDDDHILIELDTRVASASSLTTTGERIGQSSWWSVPVQGDVNSTVAAYTQLPGVLSAMPDYVVELASHEGTASDPNDHMFQDKCLWGLDNHTGDGGNICGFTSGTSGADIDAIDAWASMVDAGGAPIDGKVVVAVIDTGVDYNHPDLTNNIWVNTAESNGTPGKDDDGNGYVDDIRGWDFVGRGDRDPMDLNGHGTHVAGTIGAAGNNDGTSTGMVGVAYNNVSIMPLRVFDANGRGKSSSVIAAINYAVANGAKISNNSYSIGGLEQVIANATARGHLFIAAAGNSNTSAPAVPASYQPATDSVISVAASTRFDTYASFSNYGSTVDLAAPGDLIWSTYPISLDTGDGTREGYRRMSGTSMATPHVVGAAALVWAHDPSLSALDVKARLLSSVDPMSSSGGKFTVTNGRLNAAHAVVSTSVASTSSAATSGGSTGTSSSSQLLADEGGQAITSVSVADDSIAPAIVTSAVPCFHFAQWATEAPRVLVSELKNAAGAETHREAFAAPGVRALAAATTKGFTADRSAQQKSHESLNDSVFADFERWSSLDRD